MGELSEILQWEHNHSTPVDGKTRSVIEGEVGDMAIHLLSPTDVPGVDISAAVKSKLEANYVMCSVKSSRVTAVKKRN